MEIPIIDLSIGNVECKAGAPKTNWMVKRSYLKSLNFNLKWWRRVSPVKERDRMVKLKACTTALRQERPWCVSFNMADTEVWGGEWQGMSLVYTAEEIKIGLHPEGEEGI